MSLKAVERYRTNHNGRVILDRSPQITMIGAFLHASVKLGSRVLRVMYLRGT